MSGYGMLYGALAALLAGSPLAAQQRVELPAKDRPLTLDARTLFQVGEVDGEEYETFGNVNDVAFDRQGNLYVLDASAYRVLVFDPKGTFIRAVGRQGGGPGEFGFPSALAILPSGELVVNDAAKGSLQVFSPAGEYLRSVTLEEDLGRAVGRMRSSGNGIITETMPVRRLMDPAQRGTGQRLQLPPRSVTWLAFGESVTGHRLFNAPPREMKLSAPQQAGGGAVRVSMSISAFEPSLLWAPLPGGGVAALNTADYRIGISDANGKPLRYLERPIAPRKVTDADRKRFLENRRNGVGGQGGGVAIAFAGSGSGAPGAAPRAPNPGALRVNSADIKESDVNWGDVIPVVRALGVDSFGRLWVQRSNQEQTDGPIDLIDAGFRYLGTLPDQEMPRAFGPDGRLAYVVRDELDVQRVVVKQMSR